MEPTSIDRDLVLDFFLVMSRMEYALKAAGYVSGNGSKASPKWDTFASDIKENFNVNGNNCLATACNYYLDYPPAKQVYKNGILEWKSERYLNKSECERLFLWVRCVRNNLFHGAKYDHQFRSGTDRNEQLLKYGIEILKEGLRLNQEVQFHYNDASI